MPACTHRVDATEDVALPASALPFSVQRYTQGVLNTVQDALANEVPVALVYNGISHVVMLASPADLEDFAYGFGLTEGIIDEAGEYYGVELQSAGTAGVEVHIELASAAFAGLKHKRRNLTGRTGCGLCGAESLQQVFKQPLLAGYTSASISHAALQRALVDLQQCQPLQQQTGASHASALVSVQGEIMLVREDVGRHNALDKLLGALLRQHRLDALGDGWILTTSRASYEMVQKVAMAGGRSLVAMSAPTAFAVELASQYDMTLVGFARPGQYVVYHGHVMPSDG